MPFQNVSFNSSNVTYIIWYNHGRLVQDLNVCTVVVYVKLSRLLWNVPAETNAQLDSHNTDNTYYLILDPMGYSGCTVYQEGAGSTHPAFNPYAAGS